MQKHKDTESDITTENKSNFWYGYIESLYDNELYCILKKDCKCDTEMTISKEFLSEQQNEMIRKGTVLRYNCTNNEVQFMMADGENWC